MTFSILAIDRTSGALGAAVQSKFPGVGTLILHGAPGVAVLATQAFSNPRHGGDGLALMRHGASPEEVLPIVLRGDDHRDERQVAAVDQRGRVASFTGDAVKSWDGWAGSKLGKGCVAHGNSLSNPTVVDAMVRAFEESTGELAARLIGALQAGQAAGGELRGQQSAAVRVLREGTGYGAAGGVEVDISVYDHPTPIDELQRCYELHRLSYFPSDPERVVPIDDALRQELGAVLRDLGYLPGVPGAWGADAIAALKRFMGVENYDNRLRDDAKVDLDVVDDVRRRHAAGLTVKRPGA